LQQPQNFQKQQNAEQPQNFQQPQNTEQNEAQPFNFYVWKEQAREEHQQKQSMKAAVMPPREGSRQPQYVKKSEMKGPSPPFTDCCGCLAEQMPDNLIDEYQKEYKFIRELFDRTFPGKWFLTGGTLIAALRYGESVKRLKSGKVTLVDIDVDICLICPNHERTAMITRLMEAFPDHYRYRKTKKHPNLEEFTSELRIPSECPAMFHIMEGSPAMPRGMVLHVDVSFAYENPDGTLNADPLMQDMGHPWFAQLPGDASGTPMSFNDVILPFKRAWWAGGEVNVPNHFLALLATEHNGEYGEKGKWKGLWRSGKLFPSDYCTCAPNATDDQETQSEIRSLAAPWPGAPQGYASFIDLINENWNNPDLKIIENYQWLHYYDKDKPPGVDPKERPMEHIMENDVPWFPSPVADFVVKAERDVNGSPGFVFEPKDMTISQVDSSEANAALKNLRPMAVGDKVVAVNGQPVAGPEDFERLTLGAQEFSVKLSRDDKAAPPKQSSQDGPSHQTDQQTLQSVPANIIEHEAVGETMKTLEGARSTGPAPGPAAPGQQSQQQQEQQ
jgi:hypothetical protein